MDEEIKKKLKKLAQDTEMGVAKSILRWKYKKEEKPVPMDHQLENQSRQVADRAHQVVKRRAKNVWHELRKVYLKGNRKKEDSPK